MSTPRRRRRPTTDFLDGYVSGPPAGTEATARALERLEHATAVLCVEGISDQIAVETLARRRGRDLAAERIVVLPMGGAHAVGRHLELVGPQGMALEVAGLCDTGELDVVLRGLFQAGLGTPRTAADLAHLGFFVCDRDLEDELIRAVGTEGVLACLDDQGDLGAFRTLQHQPPWRDRDATDQLRRFLGSGARRKLRYARLLTGTAVDLARVPRPLDDVLGAV